VELFSAIVRQYDVGAVVSLDLVRDGRPLRLDVTLAASPASTRELAEYRDVQFDFSARDLTFHDRLQRALDREQAGALVTGVESGGWAALAQLAAGDIVLAVDGKQIPDAAALEAYMKDVARRRPNRVVFFVRRGVHTLFLEVEPAWAVR
jgi:S1-C subfamily serine protease